MPVRISHAKGILVVDSGLVEIRFDMAKGTFTASSGGTAFVRAGRLSGKGGHLRQGYGGQLPSVASAEEGGAAGTSGSARAAPTGAAGQIKVAGEAKIVNKITPVTATVDIGRPPGEERGVGCACGIA